MISYGFIRHQYKQKMKSLGVFRSTVTKPKVGGWIQENDVELLVYL